MTSTTDSAAPGDGSPATRAEFLRLIAECMDLASDDLPDGTEDLIDHGLHSVGIMQFVSACRQRGIDVELAELSRTPTIDDWWRLLSERQRTRTV
ncbi:phosphopantetheine-binding protein [Micromonospora sp. NBS 11-29]|uniref:phosphopantetheine-binding protein n=1 Tax=Micromonospora sp. NBS 11-29 TaxID=1960879 RepID=UPI000B773D9A|nr:phosphopantetheine-binding protein [Micromonospora sp. NBS 11-29]